ncbi:MAG: DMT family transporter [Muribaculaceae bacterium]|nr:DMT family transporter [Muribaculaceae bacterium]
MRINKLKYHLLALLVVLVWGVSFINTKVLLGRGVTPTEIYVYRFIIAYVGILAICRFKVRFCGWHDELLMAVCGLTGGTAYFIMQNVALDLTLVSDVVVLVAVNPLFTTLLAAMFLKEEHFTWSKVLGSLIAFLGVGVLTFHKGFVWGDGLLGDILSVLAALAWAIYSVIIKRLNSRHTTLEITRKTFFYGILSGLPFLLCQDTLTPLSTLFEPEIVGHMLFLSLVCSMLAFFWWGRVTKGIGAISSSTYLYLDPIVSLAAAAIVLDERIGLVGLAGCALILLGIIIVERHHLHPSSEG